MLKLTEREVRSWADEQGFADLSLSELDYRLMQTLDMLYQDNFLSERLYLKGGTVINKLYLGETSRLSVDLDFNHIGQKEQVLKEKPMIRERIMELLKKQDSSYSLHWKRKYAQTTIKARYKTLVGPTQRFKIEISHIERFPILKPVEKPLETPSGQVNIATYQLEELTATKLRALFERLKGRDVYDLFFISKLKPEQIVTRKMFLYYFYRSRKVFNPQIHYRSLAERYNSGKYVDDVTGFIKPTVQFSLKNATVHIISYYSFLKEFDERDEDFLALARLLLGRQVARKKLVKIKQIERPLEYLFNNLSITDEAREISTDQIKLFQKKRQ